MNYIAKAAILEICKLKNVTTFNKCYHAEMESRGPEDSKNVKTSQAYFFEGFISFLENFSLTTMVHSSDRILYVGVFLYAKPCASST